MLYVDYYIEIGPGGFSFDPELTANKVPFADGDYFKLEVNDKGRMLFRKIANEEKFVVKGVTDD
jgi:hypothetical protein